MRLIRRLALPVAAAMSVPALLLTVPDPGAVPLRLPGLALALAVLSVGVGMLAWAARIASPRASNGALVVVGVYAHTRNPFCTGVAIMVAGEALSLGSKPLAAWCIVLVLGSHLYFVLFDEPALAQRFGIEYREYVRNVPRWLPHWSPWRPMRSATVDVTMKLWRHQDYFMAMFLVVAEGALGELEKQLAGKGNVLAVRRPGAAGAACEVLGKDATSLHGALTPLLAGLGSVDDDERREGVKRAMRDAVAAADLQDGTLTFAGILRRVADYDLLPIVRVKKSVFELTPQLGRQEISDNLYAPRGLVEAVIEALLGTASNELGRANPGEQPTWAPRDFQALQRGAGSLVMDRIALTSANESAIGGLLDRLSAVAALPYEGRAPRGKIVLARRDHPCLARTVAFEDGISLRDAKASRKALQMTSADLSLWCAGEILIGLSAKADAYDSDSEDLFEIRITGRSKWELLHAGISLMEVSFGVPALPKPPLSLASFRGVVARRLPGADVPALWGVIERAKQQGHGTMVVVSKRAQEEAQRLQSQAIRLTPARLEARSIIGLTEIDGALLLDEAGACHAIGVILDGHASDRGTNARGARYNSAVRYTDEHPDALAVVISEDGDVQIIEAMIPQLPG